MGSKAIVHITMPDKLWLGSTSRHHPSYLFFIRAFVPIQFHENSFIGNSLITISGYNPSNVLDTIKSHNSLLELHILRESEHEIDLETQTLDPYLLQSIVKSCILVNLPVKVQNGIAEFTITGARENINAFLTFLENRNIETYLKEIGEFTENADFILTPRQQEIFNAAKKFGYFDSPRKINLTALAETLSMAKSTLSSMMQRIYAKLLGNY
ncbi:MAG: helix-turn-helix domain-containing protein [Candidatus Lokiarchaeota archaeon]|nr:helix-turn-helix domain-containing protein [Candidatus Lokiarchaeota archaeon]